MTSQSTFPASDAEKYSAASVSQHAFDYWIDAWQRGVLFLETLEKRSERRDDHVAKTAPHVLKFKCELVIDGRTLARPVNYVLARIVPAKGEEIDKSKRPFVIVDPRAGHGPGIGGFKPQSEIGVALKAGHACYFIGFLPQPEPGQTIEDVCRAEAIFLERVISLHPEAEGRPAVVGNCQAGWAIMMLAALRPELFGPIIVAGSPLSYWAGKHGENPMRYTAGLLGGSWLTALTSDLGNGKFDGAWLVSNFENLNPSNTLWSKQYNLYSKIDTETPRYLEFEQWWGAHVQLNGEEMQFIADELFIGNRLASSEIVTSDGSRVDLRNIRSPIVVFCSKSDNITPPPQALDWILDLYESVDDIRAHGQTIVYAVHDTIGHLGIFVSGAIAKKEHDQFTSNIDLIDVLPPGLYEAVMTPKNASDIGADLIAGDYLVRFETRTFDDIRALGVNDREDDKKFAAVARVSEINLALYRTFVQPWVRMCANEGGADWLRQMHPLHLQYAMFSPHNPFLGAISSAAALARENRQPVSKDNPFWVAQNWFADLTEIWLDAYRDVRDCALETTFHAVYGAPFVQALVGLDESDKNPRAKPAGDTFHAQFIANRVQELKEQIPEGGAREALIRALIYVRMPDGVVDERGFNFLRKIRKEAGKGLTLSEFKKLVRDQYLMLLVDERRAVDAIPAMLLADPDRANSTITVLRRLFDVVGINTISAKTRLDEIERLFDSVQSQLRRAFRDAERGAHPGA